MSTAAAPREPFQHEIATLRREDGTPIGSMFRVWALALGANVWFLIDQVPLAPAPAALDAPDEGAFSPGADASVTRNAEASL